MKRNLENSGKTSSNKFSKLKLKSEEYFDCPVCKGLGEDPNGPPTNKCPKCGGIGQVRKEDL
jgi:DnaJ-class molecular chaperone